MHFLSKFSRLEKWILFVSIAFVLWGVFGVSYKIFRQTYNIKPKGGTYVESMEGRVSILNPLLVLPGGVESDIFSFIFSGLMKYDPETKDYVSDLSSSFEISSDFKEYTFYIRDDVFWHDGEKFTLDDIEFTFNLIQDESFSSVFYNLFKDVKYQIDSENQKIKFILPMQDDFFIQTFTFPILPKHILDHMAVGDIRSSYFSNNPIGTGPFRLMEFVKLDTKDIVTFTYFKNYYGNKKPNISYITLECVEEEKDISSYTSALYAQNFTFPGFQENSLFLPYYDTFFFNFNSDISKGKGIRRAFSYMVQLLQKEKKEHMFVDMFVEESEHDTVEYFVKENSTEDIKEKIKELLYMEGWQIYTNDFDDGIRRDTNQEKLTINIKSLDNQDFRKIIEEVAVLSKEFGVELHAEFFDWEPLYSEIQFSRYDVLLVSVEEGYKKDFYKLLHSTQRYNFVSGRNFSQFFDFEVDLLLEDLRLAENQERSDKILNELEKRYDEYIPFVYIQRSPYVYGTSSNLKGLRLPGFPRFSYDRFYYFNEFYFE